MAILVHADAIESFAKAATLIALAGDGFPVPAGVVVHPQHVDPAAWGPLQSLLAMGPVVARGCLEDEDGPDFSGAGRSRTIGGVTDRASLELAFEQIVTDARGESGRVLVQREIERTHLLVAVRDAGTSEFHVEVHDRPGVDALARGRTPQFGGLLKEWDHAATDEVVALCERAWARRRSDRGLDLELVVDSADSVHLVQSRPLTAPLNAGWGNFVDALGATEIPPGELVLDAEHNPAPLSPAHAWLMAWLARARPGSAGDPVVLAGWLYMRQLPRELGRARPADTLSVHAVLDRLQRIEIPRLRAALESQGERLDREGRPTPADLDRALGEFLAMTDLYVQTIVPARRAGAASIKAPSRTGGDLTLRDRDAHLDVLPASWDISSPALAELIDVEETTPEPSAVPSDPGEATLLLGEWDDHLFALALAGVRRVWLAAAKRLGVDETIIFSLEGDELRAFLEHRPPLRTLHELAAVRQRDWLAQRALRPPARIRDGQPVPESSAGLGRGIPFGEPAEGRIAKRADLESLIRVPPPPDAIVCIPALTAPAAVAIARLGIRALCTEHGGALSHGALIARELGLSALIRCRGCMALPDGIYAHLDTIAGRLRIPREELRSRLPRDSRLADEDSESSS
jgi:hypothetical protein